MWIQESCIFTQITNISQGLNCDFVKCEHDFYLKWEHDFSFCFVKRVFFLYMYFLNKLSIFIEPMVRLLLRSKRKDTVPINCAGPDWQNWLRNWVQCEHCEIGNIEMIPMQITKSYVLRDFNCDFIQCEHDFY